jgi:hypothetical protein
MRIAVNIPAPETPVQTATTMGGIAMLEDIEKLLDVVEDLVTRLDATNPADSDKLVALGARLESLAFEIKDKTESV